MYQIDHPSQKFRMNQTFQTFQKFRMNQTFQTNRHYHQYQ
jgi:hypothetical protein